MVIGPDTPHAPGAARPVDSLGAPTEGRPVEQLSFADLLGRLFADLADLFRKEAQLVRAEINDKITQVEIGLGSLAAGAIILLVSLIVLALALVHAVSQIGEPNIGVGWASLIVGVILAAIGAFLAMKGARDMNPSNLTPDRTVRQVEKDARLAKDQVT